MKTELNKCPFCGSHRVLIFHNSEREGKMVIGTNMPLNTWMVECQECFAGTGYEKTEKSATEAWNRRA